MRHNDLLNRKAAARPRNFLAIIFAPGGKKNIENLFWSTGC